MEGLHRERNCKCNCCKMNQGPKRTHKAKNSREQHQRIFWTIRGGYRSLSSKTRVLRQITPASSPERSAKSLSHSFFCGAFSAPKWIPPGIPRCNCFCNPRVFQRNCYNSGESAWLGFVTQQKGLHLIENPSKGAVFNRQSLKKGLHLPENTPKTTNLIDILMGLFRGAVFDHGWGARKLPISVNGAFPLLNGPFSDLNEPFPRVP